MRSWSNRTLVGWEATVPVTVPTGLIPGDPQLLRTEARWVGVAMG